MELILKNGMWLAKTSEHNDKLERYFELSDAYRKLFEVLLNVEIILRKIK